MTDASPLCEAYEAFRILRAETGDLEDFLLLEIHKRISFIREEPGHIYDAANQIEIGENYTVYLEGLKTVNRLRVLQDAMSRQKNQLPKEAKKDAALPSLGDVVKDAATFLPKLWEALASMPNPLVSRSGTFIWSGESVSVLMALAQALKTAEKVLGNYTTEQVYRILCRHFKEPETKRPRIKNAAGFTYAYSDHLAAFNDTLRDL